MLRLAVAFTCLGMLSLVAGGVAACSDSTTTPGPTGAGGTSAAGGAGASALGAVGGAGVSALGGAGGAAASSSATAGADAGDAGASLGGSPATPGNGGQPGLGGAGGSADCTAVIEKQALSLGIHVTACSNIDYATNPPSSGEHYPIWADFGVYDFALPRGFWVHNLEHGAVVVTYNCPAGCADEVAAATAWLAQLKADPTCLAGPPRVLLVPDPKLDVRWAASSWGFTLRDDCFDAAAFSDFYASHVGQPLAPEAGICSPGVDFRQPNVDTCGAK